jgi:hypothetical protein
MTETATPDDGALTIDAFCEKYSTSRATAYREIASGALIAKKRGTRTLIPIHCAREWLAALPGIPARKARTA